MPVREFHRPFDELRAPASFSFTRSGSKQEILQRVIHPVPIVVSLPVQFVDHLIAPKI
jgi:hypothetical protein